MIPRVKFWRSGTGEGVPYNAEAETTEVVPFWLRHR